jgi:hypothetical protein
MHHPEKTKPAKRKRTLLERLQSREHVVPFDFVATTTLEQCVSRVGQMQDLRGLDPWSPVTYVNITHLDDHTYAFTIREHEPAPIELKGYMNRLDDETTYISGEASAKIYLQVGEFAFLLGLIAVLTIFVGLFVAVLFLPPFGVFAWLYWHGARRERNRLVAVIKDTLSHP